MTSSHKKKIKPNPNKKSNTSLNSSKTIIPRQKNLIPALLIFIFSFCLYANTIQNKYAFDDDVICLKNQFVQNKLANVNEIFTKGFTYGFNGLNTDSYRPLTLLSTAFEVYLYGNKPNNHHFVNVLLFSLSCLILFLVLRKMFSKYNILLPLIITLLYSAHPIHTEVVANIKSRDEILCFLFFIISLNFFMIFIKKKKMPFLVISSLFYFFSLLSKENAIPFLFIFPLIAYYFTDTTLKKIVLFSIPFFVTFLIYFIIRNEVIDTLIFTTQIDMVNNSLMAAENYSNRLATAFSMLGKYVILLIFPLTLVCDYSYNTIPITSWADPKAFVSFIIYAGAFIFALITLKKKNYFSFAILFFLITFSTVSNIFKIIGSSMAERFMFIPSLGFVIILALLLVKIFKIDIKGNNKKGLIPMFFILGIILSLYSFRTIDRNKDWKDNEHLFWKDVKTNPASFRLHYAVGSAARVKGEAAIDTTNRNKYFKEAISHYYQSLAIIPKQAETWYNMGVCYYAFNDIEKAMQAYKQCIQYDPNYKSAYNNIGVIYFKKFNYDSASYYFNKTIQLDPRNADAISNVGAILHTNGKYDEALQYYEKSLEIMPNNKNIYTNMIKIYERKNDKNKIEYYKNKLKELN